MGRHMKTQCEKAEVFSSSLLAGVDEVFGSRRALREPLKANQILLIFWGTQKNSLFKWGRVPAYFVVSHLLGQICKPRRILKHFQRPSSIADRKAKIGGSRWVCSIPLVRRENNIFERLAK
ncbi:hypothetical protein AVEN_155941-1 [Araneus ventricosus]|uniref:Uncharacterized protein n=1 Tax=Araneus ventricosus TaxID=182803 RepID=A0A4Y2UKW5_ARAVE|nr:hypothetical protein AVEN_155941-1 [Araneus ventricosus]